MKLEAKNLELRGIKNAKSKNDNVYYMVNVEEDDGTPVSFYCPDSSAFAENLQKGCKVSLVFDLSFFKGQPKLTVAQVKKA